MGRYDKVLFCADFSDTADIAFEYACDFVQQHKDKGELELHILHIMTEPLTRSGMERLDKAFKKHYLDAACCVEKCEGIKTECIVRSGLDHEQIVKYAKEENMNMIVMGTHGKSGFFKDILVGSCAKQVVLRSPIPVFVVPAPEKANI